MGQLISAEIANRKIELSVARTFSDVPPGAKAILMDDYGRVEIARNLNRFVDEVSVTIGEKVILHL